MQLKNKGVRMTKEVKSKLIEIGAGLVLYLNALFAVKQWNTDSRVELMLYIFAYIVLSVKIVWQTFYNIKHKKLFDENLLMLVATIGAMFVGRYREAVAAVLFYQVGNLVEAISLQRTKKSIAKFMDIRPSHANLKIAGGTRTVSPVELIPGNVIVVKPGERIPVDATVTQGVSMIDTKALTGEAEPREVKIGSKLFSGSINLSGMIEARVSKVYEESMAAKIMTLVEAANNKKAETEKLADRFTRYYTPIVILMGILVMILPPMMIAGQDRHVWIYRGLIFLVAACPCGLLVSVPLAFLGGIGAASRQGVLIKGSNYLEALSQTETFVFDKTGTLTEGVFTVKEICPRGMSEQKLLELAAYGEVHSNHPIAQSLREAYGKTIDTARVSHTREYSGFGVESIVDGQVVFAGNAKYMNKQGFYYQPVSDIGTAVHIAVDGEYAGYILISDIIRPGVKKMVRWLDRHQIESVMLTGDNDRVAEDVAKKVGIHSVFANLMPEDKVEQLEDFMESRIEEEKLAFVGDGINDAPVLARADIGIAMGGLGADAALEAADIILMEDEPIKIVNAIRISKGTIRAVKQNMIFAIGMKVYLLVLALFGYVSMENAIIADVGVMLLNILNSFWILKYPE